MLTIYHNPRCSKSREALALLEQLATPFQVVNYLTQPLEEPALRQLLTQLGLTAQQLIRTKETEYTALGLDATETSEERFIAALLQYPKLIERPIVVHQGKAVIARPAARVMELF